MTCECVLVWCRRRLAESQKMFRRLGRRSRTGQFGFRSLALGKASTLHITRSVIGVSVPMGLSLIDSSKPASQFSSAVIAAMPSPRHAQIGHSVAGVRVQGGGGAVSSPFAFETGSLVTNPKAPSKVAAKLATPEFCKYSRPGDALRPGDSMLKFDKLFCIEGMGGGSAKAIASGKGWSCHCPGKSRCSCSAAASAYYPSGRILAASRWN